MCLHAPSFFSVHSNNIRSAACISVPPQHSFLLYGSVQTDAPPARILYSYVARWRFICLYFNKKAKTSIICLYTFSLLQKGCVRVMIRWVCVRVFVSVCFGTIFLKRERKLNWGQPLKVECFFLRERWKCGMCPTRNTEISPVWQTLYNGGGPRKCSSPSKEREM